MSQYINLFVEREGIFIPLDSYSRSSALYREISDRLPFEKLCRLTDDNLRFIASALSEKIDFYKEQIKSCEKDKIAIGSFNNSLEEKLDAFENINQEIFEWEESIAEIESARSFLTVLADIAVNGNYEEPPVHVYAGIEICNPTKEDIIGE